MLDYVWGFWQYSLLTDCASIPADAAHATDDAIWDSVDTISGFSAYTDQGLNTYTPYYYQAGTQAQARPRSTSRPSRRSTSATATSRRGTSCRARSR